MASDRLVSELNRDVDWAWLAGIFEGEGTAVMRRNKGRWASSKRRQYIYAAISQTNRQMLEEVQRIAGKGKIYATPARVEGRKDQFMWYVSSKTAREFLTALLPHMRSPHKRDQVIVALAEEAKAREEGAIARRANLTLCRTKRWEAYRLARIS